MRYNQHARSDLGDLSTVGGGCGNVRLWEERGQRGIRRRTNGIYQTPAGEILERWARLPLRASAICHLRPAIPTTVNPLGQTVCHSLHIYIYIYTYSSTPRVFRVFWMVVFDGWSLPRKSEKSVKIGKNQPINRPLIQRGEARSAFKTMLDCGATSNHLGSFWWLKSPKKVRKIGKNR